MTKKKKEDITVAVGINSNDEWMIKSNREELPIDIVEKVLNNVCHEVENASAKLHTDLENRLKRSKRHCKFLFICFIVEFVLYMLALLGVL